MTATRRKYTAKQRAEAVGIAVVEGVTRAEETVGIPKETIQYWTRKPEFAHLRTIAREVVVEALWVGIQVGVDEVTKGLRGDAPPDKKAAALAILYDRYALMTGAATSRSENRTLTEGLDDHERDALRKLLEEAIEAATSDPAPTPS